MSKFVIAGRPRGKATAAERERRGMAGAETAIAAPNHQPSPLSRGHHLNGEERVGMALLAPTQPRQIVTEAEKWAGGPIKAPIGNSHRLTSSARQAGSILAPPGRGGRKPCIGERARPSARRRRSK